MTQAVVPQGHGRLGSTKSFLIRRRRRWRLQRVESSSTSASVKNSPRPLFLNQEMIRMKFKVNIIVFGKAIDRTQTFVCLRNVKDVFKIKRSTRGT